MVGTATYVHVNEMFMYAVKERQSEREREREACPNGTFITSNTYVTQHDDL